MVYLITLTLDPEGAICHTKIVIHSIFWHPYSWIADQLSAHKKSICQQTRRATAIPRPPLESSWQRKSRPALYIFVKNIVDLFFQNLLPNNMPKQKYTRQNWINLIEYSSAEVSDPSEGPRIDGKLIFYLVKEVKLICMRLITSFSCVPAIF